MANCNVCGTFVQEGVKTCPNCGSPIASAVAAQAAQVVDTAAQAVDQTAAQAAQAVEGAVNTTAAQAAPAASSAPAFLGSMGAANGNMDAKNNKKLDAIANSLDGKDFTANYTAKDIEDNKLFAILAYFGILCLIPLFAAEELAAYDEPSNYLMQFCTNRSGMFSVDIELIFRVVLAMAFFSMCIELFHIAKQNYPVVFLIYVVTNLIVRFMCIHHVEGTQVVMFLVQPLAMPITLLYYVVMATIGMRCLRNYYTGFEGKPEAIISTAGDTSF